METGFDQKPRTQKRTGTPLWFIVLLLGLPGLLLGALLIVIFGLLPGYAGLAAQQCFFEGACAIGGVGRGRAFSTPVSGLGAYGLGLLYAAMGLIFSWLLVSRVVEWLWPGKKTRGTQRADRPRNGRWWLYPLTLAYLLLDMLLAKVVVSLLG